MRKPLLVRRGQVSDFGSGDRDLSPLSGVALWGRLPLLSVSSTMCVATTDRCLALTYDDGPDPDSTPAVLDVLAENEVRATFFLLADRAETEAALVRRMVDEGHEIGLHGEDHSRLSALPISEAVRRIKRGRRRLEAVAGRPVRYYRPAYGAQRAPQVLAVRAMGMEVVIWSGWSLDWQPGDVEVSTARALGAVHPGGVLLLHDSTGESGPPALRQVADPALVAAALLPRLRTEGYRVTTVGDLLATYPSVRCPWFEGASAARSVPDDARAPV